MSLTQHPIMTKRARERAGLFGGVIEMVCGVIELPFSVIKKALSVVDMPQIVIKA